MNTCPHGQINYRGTCTPKCQEGKPDYFKIAELEHEMGFEPSVTEGQDITVEQAHEAGLHTWHDVKRPIKPTRHQTKLLTKAEQYPQCPMCAEY